MHQEERQQVSVTDLFAMHMQRKKNKKGYTYVESEIYEVCIPKAKQENYDDSSILEEIQEVKDSKVVDVTMLVEVKWETLLFNGKECELLLLRDVTRTQANKKVFNKLHVVQNLISKTATRELVEPIQYAQTVVDQLSHEIEDPRHLKMIK